MKALTVGSATVTLQLWDTAGQERSVPHAPALLALFFYLDCFQTFRLSPHTLLRLFRFCSMTEQYYRKADGLLAVYDLTRSASFTALRGWVRAVKVSRERSHGR